MSQKSLLKNIFYYLVKQPLRQARALIPNMDNKNCKKISWFTPDFTDKQFENYLYEEILKKAIKNDSYIVFSELNYVAISLAERLRKYGLRLGVISAKVVKALEHDEVRHFSSLAEITKTGVPIHGIVITNPSSKVVHQIFTELRKISALENVLLIFKIRDRDTYPLLTEFDQYPDFVFVTSQFDDGLFEDIYRYSLTKVTRKCQVRDAYDLFQCLQHTKHMDGDIIEFGSFQGHSGLLMAEFIKRKKIEKKLYLCDMFDKFPNESLGVDKIWSGTHIVDFSNVKNLFEPYNFVSLIRGDFKNTVYEIPSKKFAFVMIDCDSYRATRFVADFIFPKLVQGGMILFEDYGHGPCLGARMAVDEFLAVNKDSIFSIFSFFSGVLVVVKLA